MLNRVEISSIRAVLGAALLFAVVVGVLIQPQNPARGQEIMRIAAVVNDDVISIYDLAARVNIVVASSNLRDAPELRRQIAPQVLRTLVDEYLQTQEAARLDIAVTERDIEITIDRIEQKCENLALAPEMGFACDELSAGLLCWPVGKYVIFYRSLDSGIEIVRVLHGARDIPREFE